MGRGRGRAYVVLEFAHARIPGAVWQYVRREDGQWFMRFISSDKVRSGWTESVVGPVDDVSPKMFEATISIPRAEEFTTEAAEE